MSRRRRGRRVVRSAVTICAVMRRVGGQLLLLKGSKGGAPFCVFRFVFVFVFAFVISLYGWLDQ